jgi:hypothetical protein
MLAGVETLAGVEGRIRHHVTEGPIIEYLDKLRVGDL